MDVFGGGARRHCAPPGIFKMALMGHLKCSIWIIWTIHVSIGPMDYFNILLDNFHLCPPKIRTQIRSSLILIIFINNT